MKVTGSIFVVGFPVRLLCLSWLDKEWCHGRYRLCHGRYSVWEKLTFSFNLWFSTEIFPWWQLTMLYIIALRDYFSYNYRINWNLYEKHTKSFGLPVLESTWLNSCVACKTVETGEKRKRSWSAYLNQFKNEKDKLRKRLERKNKVVSPSEAEQIHQKCKERVCLHRYRKKLSSIKTRVEQLHEDCDYAYKSAQALGKATGKVESCLPASLRKKVAVIWKLADSYGIPSIYI